MPIKSRSDLKKLFKDGSTPNEKDFADLIDSALNKMDDEVQVNEDEGLSLSPMGKLNRMISFFSRQNAVNPAWSIEMDPGGEGLNFTEDTDPQQSRLFLQKGGNLGVQTENPQYDLHVNGTVGMKSRTGTYLSGAIPADGTWYKITPELNGCYAFEVVLKAFGTKGKGQYAIVHAIAISTYSGKKGAINETSAWFGRRRHRIEMRWRGSTFATYLEIRTRKAYADNAKIKYSIMEL